MIERYGVGATPLREALNRLSTSALIQGEDRRGFRVAPATVAHLEDILATRLAIEPILLQSAFKMGDLAWEARVLAAFHQLRGAGEMYKAGTHAIRSEWEIAHRAFHASVLSSATLELLLQFQTVLWDHAARYRNLVASAGLEPDVLLQEHGQICDTVLARDVDWPACSGNGTSRMRGFPFSPRCAGRARRAEVQPSRRHAHAPFSGRSGERSLPPRGGTSSLPSRRSR